MMWLMWTALSNYSACIGERMCVLKPSTNKPDYYNHYKISNASYQNHISGMVHKYSMVIPNFPQIYSSSCYNPGDDQGWHHTTIPDPNPNPRSTPGV